jgi:hypothetical protein
MTDVDLELLELLDDDALLKSAQEAAEHWLSACEASLLEDGELDDELRAELENVETPSDGCPTCQSRDPWRRLPVPAGVRAARGDLHHALQRGVAEAIDTSRSLSPGSRASAFAMVWSKSACRLSPILQLRDAVVYAGSPGCSSVELSRHAAIAPATTMAAVHSGRCIGVAPSSAAWHRNGRG